MRALPLLLPCVLALVSCRSAPPPLAPREGKTIRDLDVAVYPYPFTMRNLDDLRRVNLTGRLPGPPISPEQMLGIYMDMLRRNFKSARLFDSKDDIPAEGFDLHYGLNLLLIYGFVSGASAEVHLTSHFFSPEGELVEHVLHDVKNRIPYPATSNMLREGTEEARDITEKDIRGSAKLAEYARTR